MNDPKSRELDGVLANLPFVKEVITKEVALDRTFEQVPVSFAGDSGSVLLLSGPKLDSSRYNILAIKPWLAITSKHKNVRIKYSDNEFCIEHEPFFVVQALLDRFKFNNKSKNFPVLSGLFGYFAYDLKDLIEKLPCTCSDTGLPDLCLFALSIILVQDTKTD